MHPNSEFLAGVRGCLLRDLAAWCWVKDQSKAWSMADLEGKSIALAAAKGVLREDIAGDLVVLGGLASSW